LGEFLAIVHALALCQKKGWTDAIYTDSMTAQAWIKKKAVKSTLLRSPETAEVWDLVDRAIDWLKKNPVERHILKWDTKNWGEIPADFGRK